MKHRLVVPILAMALAIGLGLYDASFVQENTIRENNLRIIDGLKPESVWKYFAEVSSIPRQSKDEGKVRDFIISNAKSLGLTFKKDAYGNLVVKVPPSHGREKVASICLQAHLDMVTVKAKELTHDFASDPIEFVRSGEFIAANGTTLGADNGVGVAAILAIMNNPQVSHGPLELLFTVEEELGLVGAINMDSALITSKRLVNLDGEEEGQIYVSSAGFTNSIGRLPIRWERPPEKAVLLEVKIDGFAGGHSGLDIDKNRGNAIKILNEVLLRFTEEGVYLMGISGGSAINAIPSTAQASCFSERSKLSQLHRVLDSVVASSRLDSSDRHGMKVGITEVTHGSQKRQVISMEQQKSLCRVLASLPHGVIKMSVDIPGLVETSSNLGVVGIKGDTLTITTSQRGSNNSELKKTRHLVDSVFGSGNFTAAHSMEVLGWKANLQSHVLKVAKRTYQSLWGKEPIIKAVHAGVEAGIIAGRFSIDEAISIGPTTQNTHSLNERVNIESVKKFWDFLTGMLKNMN